MSLNKVFLIGNLCAEPELKLTGDGGHVCRFRMAVNRRYQKDACDYITCCAFGKTAEFVAQYFSVGRGIVVAGRLQCYSYTDKGGAKRYVTEVIADEVDFDGTRPAKPATETERAAFREQSAAMQMQNLRKGAGITAETFAGEDDAGGGIL